MWVALGVLIIMTLAGLAMLRGAGGTMSIAGNVAFKQSATSLGDLGVETARAWVMAQNSSVLKTTDTTVGYSSDWGTSVDPTTYSWTSAAVTLPVDPDTGNTVKYIIHRLCSTAGLDANAVGQQCSGQSASGGSMSSDGNKFASTVQPYFRITSQVTGPRSTVSYTQVITN